MQAVDNIYFMNSIFSGVNALNYSKKGERFLGAEYLMASVLQ